MIRRRFATTTDLIHAIYASLVQHLEQTGAIQARPFDEHLSLDATLDDLDAQAVEQFVRRARHERRFSLPENTAIPAILTHLNLICDDRATHASGPASSSPLSGGTGSQRPS